MDRRIIETSISEEDKIIEGSLRPQYLEDYIGQEKAKQNLKVYIEAAKKRNDPHQDSDKKNYTCKCC